MTLKIMKSGRFNEIASAMELLLNSAISFASNKEAYLLVLKWFVSGKVTDVEGIEIQGTQINT